MSALSVEVPYPVFQDRDGEPLENGYVWIGQVNQNPQTNPIQVYFDRDLTQPAAQPLRTIAGYISNAGTPAQIFVNAANYSILVQDKNGTMAYNFPDGTGITAGASSVNFTGFKGQSGVVQDIADGDGSDWIGFAQPNVNAVARSAQDKMGDIVNVRDFGAVGNGVADDTNAFANALTYIVSKGITVSGQKRGMPALYIPNGRYRITQKKTLSNAFQVGGLFAGICFFGQGRGNTEIIYDSTNGEADNYLASFRNCVDVEFSELSIRFTGNGVLRGIEWFGGAGPQGSVISWKNVSIYGNYKIFFDVTGVSLGSETYWENMLADGPTAGNVFFNVTENPQSVNHLFMNCTIGVRGGTVFNFNAGGNFKWYGGYTSFIGANPGTFLNIVGPGNLIGATNNDFLIDGWHPETNTAGATATILNLNAAGFVTFRACNFQQPSIASGHFPFVIGQTNQQRSGTVNFLECTGVEKRKQLNGGVSVCIDKCPVSSDWQNHTELNKSTVFNQLSPSLIIRNSVSVIDGSGTIPARPRDCAPYAIERVISGSTTTIAQITGRETFVWMGKAGGGDGGGLITGFNNVYRTYTFKIPLGSILKKVTFVYVRKGLTFGVARQFKVTNSSGSITFIPETTIPENDTNIVVFSSDLWYSALDETSRDIVVSGRTNVFSTAIEFGDVGYVVVEYL
jgi:hypothetical protein